MSMVLPASIIYRLWPYDMPNRKIATAARDDTVSNLIDENQLVLLVLRNEIQALAPKRYAEEIDDLGGSTIGRHCRHIGEHYDALFPALAPALQRSASPTGSVAYLEYDSRQRCGQFETCRDFAMQRLSGLSERLEKLRSLPPNTALRMRCIAGDNHTPVASETTLARELVFLVAHTVHHGAVIALLMSRFGRTPDTRLWVAASTRFANGLSS